MRLEIKRHERIKMQLRLAGTSLAQIARELGVQPSTVASVSRGKSRSRRIEDRIAAALAVPPSRLWPDRYAGTLIATSCSDPTPSGGASP
ncbi:MAG: hypothetical protein ABS98_15830 [Lysobacteraceae bacterium SCN 69-48]|nr:MAG: hypothetical protein ABS98_15830 [Xanthomonadaceae bacterium SCN 69-48]